jgi:hypothetical protein
VATIDYGNDRQTSYLWGTLQGSGKFTMIQALANRESFSGSGGRLVGSGKWLKGFFYSAGVILLITALAKLLSAGGSARILSQSDPIFKISFRWLLTIVGIFELAVAAFCFFANRLRAQATVLAWLGTNFVFYRFSLFWIGYHKPCPCLGQLTDVLHVSPQIADGALKCILTYLIFGSYGTLLWLTVQSRRAKKCNATTASCFVRESVSSLALPGSLQDSRIAVESDPNSLTQN